MRTPAPGPKRPLIGITLDSEKGGTREKPAYSLYPWYALRENYAGAIA
ncbi:MAG: hypothetical protein INR65_11465, partial [Gluconacetobacter diazotrophicus]|nr:hypothetical protein [Gluconacetobacter diazotrophicus]